MTALYDMDQVAEKLRKSRRWLQDFLRDHPYYRTAGRTKLFTDADVTRLIEALPCPESRSRSRSFRRAQTSRRTGTSGAPISEDTLIGG